MNREPVVQLLGASIAQGDNILLHSVNFELCAGDFFYLVGRVGSGKSSFLSTLTGEIPLRVGQGCVCGYDLRSLCEREIPYLRRNIGVVFQDFKLLPDRTVERNLHFVLRATGWSSRRAIRERIAEVLALVGLEHKAYKQPNQLSGGEQQRVAIARALLNDPPLILADEPTGNLDPTTSEGIMQLLFDLVERKKAVVMATHNYGIVRRFESRIFRCEAGAMQEVAAQSNWERSEEW